MSAAFVLYPEQWESTRIEIFVPGTPRPGGSKRFVGRAKNGKGIIVEASKFSPSWKSLVASRASDAMDHRPPLTGPLRVVFEFVFARPDSHMGSGRNRDRLKPTAPRRHTIKPDTTKLIRSIEDAMTAIVWKDDAQIVEQTASKSYGLLPGCKVTIMTIEH